MSRFGIFVFTNTIEEVAVLKNHMMMVCLDRNLLLIDNEKHLLVWQHPQTGRKTPKFVCLCRRKKTPWSQSASKLYRPSDRLLSAKWLPTFADSGCRRNVKRHKLMQISSHFLEVMSLCITTEMQQWPWVWRLRIHFILDEILHTGSLPSNSPGI
jgi:hypothetical protein